MQATKATFFVLPAASVPGAEEDGEVSGRAGRWQQWICGLLTGMATGVSRRVISGHESCAIRPIIARRTGVGNNLVEVLSGVVRLALIAGVG